MIIDILVWPHELHDVLQWLVTGSGCSFPEFSHLTSLVMCSIITYVPDLPKLLLLGYYSEETSDSQEVFLGHSHEFLMVIFWRQEVTNCQE